MGSSVAIDAIVHLCTDDSNLNNTGKGFFQTLKSFFESIIVSAQSVGNNKSYGFLAE